MKEPLRSPRGKLQGREPRSIQLHCGGERNAKKRIGVSRGEEEGGKGRGFWGEKELPEEDGLRKSRLFFSTKWGEGGGGSRWAVYFRDELGEVMNESVSRRRFSQKKHSFIVKEKKFTESKKKQSSLGTRKEKEGFTGECPVRRLQKKLSIEAH